MKKLKTTWQQNENKYWGYMDTHGNGDPDFVKTVKQLKNLLFHQNTNRRHAMCDGGKGTGV